MNEKEASNSRIQARYDELMQEGAHGHYETLFRVVQEEVVRERERCADIVSEARFGERGSDLRSLIYAIRNP